MCRAIWGGRGIKEREPGRDVFRDVGDEGKEEQRPEPEEDEGVNFIPCIALRALGHRARSVIA